ncbi:MAG: HEAT repeat domain-containing protein, partial [Planctomycetota bacterium]
SETDPDVLNAAIQALNSIGISSEESIPLEKGVYRASQETVKKIADALVVWYDSAVYPNGPPGLTLGNGLVLVIEGASIYTVIHEAAHAVFATIFSDDALKGLITAAIAALDPTGIIANLRNLLNIPVTKDAVFILNETLVLLTEFNALENAGALLPAQETLFTSLKTILQFTYQPDILGYVSSIPELQALRGKMGEIQDMHVTPGLLDAIATTGANPDYSLVSFNSIHDRYKVGLPPKLRRCEGQAFVNGNGIPETFHLQTKDGLTEVSVITEKALDDKYYVKQHNVLYPDGIVRPYYHRVLRRASDNALISTAGVYRFADIKKAREKYGNDLILKNIRICHNGSIKNLFGVPTVRKHNIYLNRNLNLRWGEIYLTSKRPADKMVLYPTPTEKELTIDFKWKKGKNIDSGEREDFIVSRVETVEGGKPKPVSYKRIYRKEGNAETLVYAAAEQISVDVMDRVGDSVIRGLSIKKGPDETSYLYFRHTDYKIPYKYREGTPEVEWDGTNKRPKTIIISSPTPDLDKVELTPIWETVWPLEGDRESGFRFAANSVQKIYGFHVKEYDKKGTPHVSPDIIYRKVKKKIGSVERVVYVAASLEISILRKMGEVVVPDVPLRIDESIHRASLSVGETLHLPIEGVRMYKTCDVTIGNDKIPQLGLDGKITRIHFHQQGAHPAKDLDVVRTENAIVSYGDKPLKLVWSYGPSGPELVGSFLSITPERLEEFGNDFIVTNLRPDHELKMGNSNRIPLPLRLHSRPASAHVTNGKIDWVMFSATETEANAMLEIHYEQGHMSGYTLEIEEEWPEEIEFLKAYDSSGTLIMTRQTKCGITRSLRDSGFTGKVTGPLHTDFEGAFWLGGHVFIDKAYPDEKVEVYYQSGEITYMRLLDSGVNMYVDAALDTEINNNRGLAVTALQPLFSFAKCFGISVNELISVAGKLGLAKALKGFNPDNGYVFSTYAYRPISWAGKKYIYEQSGAKSMGMIEADFWLCRKLSAIESALTGISGEQPTAEAIAAYYLTNNMGITPSESEISKFLPKVKLYLSFKPNFFKMWSLNTNIYDDDDERDPEWSAYAQITEPNPVAFLLRYEAVGKLHEAIGCLDKTKQKIVKLRIFGSNEPGWEEIGDVFEKSHEWARLQFLAALAEIEKHLTDKGFDQKQYDDLFFPLQISGEAGGGDDYVSLRRLSGMDGAYDIIDSSNASYQTMRAFTVGWIDETGATTSDGIMAALEELVAALGEDIIAGLDEMRIKKRVLTGEPEEGDVLAEFFSNENSKILEINRRLASYPKAFQRMVMIHDIAHADLDIWTLGTLSEGFMEAAAIIEHIGTTLMFEDQKGLAEILRTLGDLVEKNPTDANKALLEIHNEAFDLAGTFGDGPAYEALFELIIDYVRTYWYPDDVMLLQPLDTLKLTMDTIFGMRSIPIPAVISADGYIPKQIPLFDIEGTPLLENWRDLILDHSDYAWRVLSKVMTSAAKSAPEWFLIFIASCIDEIGGADPTTGEGGEIIEGFSKILDSVILPAATGEITLDITQTAIDKINIARGIAPHREHPTELALKSKIILVSNDHPSYAGKPDTVKWNIISAKRVHGYIHFVQQACKGALENAVYRLSREEKQGGQPIQIVLNAGTFSSRIEALRVLIGYPTDPAEASDVSVLREAMAMLAEMEILMASQPDEVDMDLWNDLHKALDNVKVEVTGPSNLARVFYLSRITEVQALQRRINEIMRESLPVPSGVLPSMASAYPDCLLERSESLPYDSPADPDTDPDVVVGHAYDTLGFVDFASRDAAFAAFSDPVTRPSEIGGIIVATAETIDGVLHFTLENGTKVVVVPHAHRPILFFHVINEAAVPDPAQVEAISESVQEAAEGLAADSLLSIFDSMFSAIDPATRITACETLSLLGTQKAIRILLDHLAAELDPAVIAAAAQILNSISQEATFLVYSMNSVHIASQGVLDKIATALPSLVTNSNPRGIAMKSGITLVSDFENGPANANEQELLDNVFGGDIERFKEEMRISTYIHEMNHQVFDTILKNNPQLIRDILIARGVPEVNGDVLNNETEVRALSEDLARFDGLTVLWQRLTIDEEILFESTVLGIEMSDLEDTLGIDIVGSPGQLLYNEALRIETENGLIETGLLDAIADGDSVRKEVTKDGLTKHHVYDKEGNLVKTYTYEPYVDSFQGQTIAFMDSTEHNVMYQWLEEKTESGEWQNDCTVINFDFHHDDHDEYETLTDGNWAGHAKQDGLAGEYWWIYTTTAHTDTQYTDFKTNNLTAFLNNLSNLPDKPVIITIDLDYLISSWYYLDISETYINNRVKTIFDMLNAIISGGYDIRGVNITRSPSNILSEWEGYALNKLTEELEKLPGLGTAKMKMRLTSISYKETQFKFFGVYSQGDDITFGPDMIHDIDLPTLKLALQEKDSRIRIAACKTLAKINIPEAAQALIDFLAGDETDPAVIAAACQAIAEIGTPETIPPLLELIIEPELINTAEPMVVMQAANQALNKVTEALKLEIPPSLSHREFIFIIDIVGIEKAISLIKRLGNDIEAVIELVSKERLDSYDRVPLIHTIFEGVMPESAERNSIVNTAIRYYETWKRNADVSTNTIKYISGFILQAAGDIACSGPDVLQDNNTVAGFMYLYPSLSKILPQVYRVHERLMQLDADERQIYFDTYALMEEIVRGQSVVDTMLPALYPFVYQRIKSGMSSANIKTEAASLISQLEDERWLAGYMPKNGIEIEIPTEAAIGMSAVDRNNLIESMYDLEFLGFDYDWHNLEYAHLHPHLLIEIKTMPTYTFIAQKMLVDFIRSEYPEADQLTHLQVHLNVGLAREGRWPYGRGTSSGILKFIETVREMSAFPSLFLYSEDKRWQDARYLTPANIRHEFFINARIENRVVGLRFGDEEGWDNVLTMNQYISTLAIAQILPEEEFNTPNNPDFRNRLRQIQSNYKSQLDQVKQQYGISDLNDDGNKLLLSSQGPYCKFYKYEDIVGTHSEWVGLTQRGASTFGVALKDLIDTTIGEIDSLLSQGKTGAKFDALARTKKITQKEAADRARRNMIDPGVGVRDYYALNLQSFIDNDAKIKQFYNELIGVGLEVRFSRDFGCMALRVGGIVYIDITLLMCAFANAPSCIATLLRAYLRHQTRHDSVIDPDQQKELTEEVGAVLAEVEEYILAGHDQRVAIKDFFARHFRLEGLIIDEVLDDLAELFDGNPYYYTPALGFTAAAIDKVTQFVQGNYDEFSEVEPAAPMTLSHVLRKGRLATAQFITQQMIEVGIPPLITELQAIITTSRDNFIIQMACFALGILGTEAAVSILTNCVTHQDEKVRLEAVKGLRRIKSLSTVSVLATAALDDSNLAIQIEATRGLGDIGHKSAVGVLCDIIISTKPNTVDLKHSAALALGRINYENDQLNKSFASSTLIVLLANYGGSGQYDYVRRAAVEALGDIALQTSIATLGHILGNDPSYHVRKEAARSLSKIKDTGTVPAIHSALQIEPSFRVREAICTALGEIGNEMSVDVLIAIMKDINEDVAVRARAAQSLDKFLDGQQSQRIIEALEETLSPGYFKVANNRADLANYSVVCHLIAGSKIKQIAEDKKPLNVNVSTSDLPEEVLRDITGYLDSMRTADNGMVSDIWNRSGYWEEFEKEEERLGWVRSPFEMQAMGSEIQDTVAELKGDGITDVVVMGMGGSTQGLYTYRQAFGDNGLRLHIVDTAYPGKIEELESSLDFSKTVFIVASKSGTTPESRKNLDYFYSRYSGTVAEKGRHFIAITNPDDSFQHEAIDKEFRKIFNNKFDIGGRWSGLSIEMLVPAAMIGVDITALLNTTAENTVPLMRDYIDPKDNPACVLAAVLKSLQDNRYDKLNLLTTGKLSQFSPWFEQLISESLGKDYQGILPVTDEPITDDPHAYENNDTVFAYIHLEGEHDAVLEAKLEKLRGEGLPILEITIPNIEALGGLFYTSQFATALVGQLMGINPFNQPGVELSKVRTNEVLAGGIPLPSEKYVAREGNITFNYESAMRAGGITDEELDEILGGMNRDDIKAVYAAILYLAKKKGRQYAALLPYIVSTPGEMAIWNEWGLGIRDSTHMATFFGEGPRYQHSALQLFQQGPNTGFFTTITEMNPAQDFTIPGDPVTMGYFTRCQAYGTRKSLEQAGRPVVNFAVERMNEITRAQLNDIFNDAMLLFEYLTGDTSSYELSQILNSAGMESTVRIDAARKLGKIGTAEAVQALIDFLLGDVTNPDVKAACAEALGQIGTPEAIEALLELLKTEPGPTMIDAALGALRDMAELGNAEAVGALTDVIANLYGYYSTYAVQKASDVLNNIDAHDILNSAIFMQGEDFFENFKPDGKDLTGKADVLTKGGIPIINIDHEINKVEGYEGEGRTLTTVHVLGHAHFADLNNKNDPIIATLISLIMSQDIALFEELWRYEHGGTSPPGTFTIDDMRTYYGWDGVSATDEVDKVITNEILTVYIQSRVAREDYAGLSGELPINYLLTNTIFTTLNGNATIETHYRNFIERYKAYYDADGDYSTFEVNASFSQAMAGGDNIITLLKSYVKNRYGVSLDMTAKELNLYSIPRFGLYYIAERIERETSTTCSAVMIYKKLSGALKQYYKKPVTSKENALAVFRDLLEKYTELGKDAFFARYGSTIGDILLSKDFGLDINLNQLHTLTGSGKALRELFKLEGKGDIKEFKDKTRWHPKQFNFSQQQMNSIFTDFLKKYTELGKDAFFARYGSIIGDILLSTDLGLDIGLSHLHTLTGSGKVLRELFKIEGKGDISEFEDGSRWYPRQFKFSQKQINTALTGLLEKYTELGKDAFFARYGSIVGDSLLSKDLGVDIGLSQLHTLTGSGKVLRELFKLEGKGDILEFEDGSRWYPRQFNISQQQMNTIFTGLLEKYTELGKDAFFARYGSTIGDILLSKDLGVDINLSQLHTLTGSGKVLRELFKLEGKGDILEFEDDSRWHPREFKVASKHMNAIFTGLLEKYTELGKDAFFARYGSTIGDILLSKHLVLDINLSHLHTLTGSGKALRELFKLEGKGDILEFEDDSRWHPRSFNFSQQQMNVIFTGLLEKYTELGKDAFFARYGSIIGDILLSKDLGVDINFNQLHTFTGSGKALREFFKIEGKGDILEFEDDSRWYPRYFSLPSKHMNAIFTDFLKKYTELGKDAFFARYGSIVGDILLSKDLGVDINLSQLHTLTGSGKALREFFKIEGKGDIEEFEKREKWHPMYFSITKKNFRSTLRRWTLGLIEKDLPDFTHAPNNLDIEILTFRDNIRELDQDTIYEWLSHYLTDAEKTALHDKINRDVDSENTTLTQLEAISNFSALSPAEQDQYEEQAGRILYSLNGNAERAAILLNAWYADGIYEIVQIDGNLDVDAFVTRYDIYRLYREYNQATRYSFNSYIAREKTRARWRVIYALGSLDKDFITSGEFGLYDVLPVNDADEMALLENDLAIVFENLEHNADEIADNVAYVNAIIDGYQTPEAIATYLGWSITKAEEVLVRLKEGCAVHFADELIGCEDIADERKSIGIDITDDDITAIYEEIDIARGAGRVEEVTWETAEPQLNNTWFEMTRIFEERYSMTHDYDDMLYPGSSLEIYLKALDERKVDKENLPNGYMDYSEATIVYEVVDMGDGVTGFNTVTEDAKGRPVYAISRYEANESGNLILRISITKGFVMENIENNNYHTIGQAIQHELDEQVLGHTHTEAVLREAYLNKVENGEMSDLVAFNLQDQSTQSDADYAKYLLMLIGNTDSVIAEYGARAQVGIITDEVKEKAIALAHKVKEYAEGLLTPDMLLSLIESESGLTPESQAVITAA